MSEPTRALTVSELTDQVALALEPALPAVWVLGEVTGWRVPASGHAYFTLKDAKCQLRAVMYRSARGRLRFQPDDGLEVLAFGAVEVYRTRGEYQLVTELLEPQGVGALQIAFEQLKTRLAAEGLFDPGRKRPLPAHPRTIGVVTSPTGAVIRDIVRVLGRRWPGLRVVLAPTRVQGTGAAEEVARALAELDAWGEADLLIVARGGGSLEDLWAFNEEAVVRAIAACRTPVVSAVGHEVDVTLADFAADLRAPTPSAAAELVVPVRADVAARVREQLERLGQAALLGWAARQRALGQLVERRAFADPARRVRELERRLDEALRWLERGARERVDAAARRLARVDRALGEAAPAARLVASRHRLERARTALGTAADRQVAARGHALAGAAGRLAALSPLAVLGRGYSLTRRPDGTLVRAATDVSPGDAVSVTLAQGRLGCEVVTTEAG